jgi:hypothetical protein
VGGDTTYAPDEVAEHRFRHVQARGAHAGPISRQIRGKVLGHVVEHGAHRARHVERDQDVDALLVGGDRAQRVHGTGEGRDAQREADGAGDARHVTQEHARTRGPHAEDGQRAHSKARRAPVLAEYRAPEDQRHQQEADERPRLRPARRQELAAARHERVGDRRKREQDEGEDCDERA